MHSPHLVIQFSPALSGKSVLSRRPVHSTIVRGPAVEARLFLIAARFCDGIWVAGLGRHRTLLSQELADRSGQPAPVLPRDELGRLSMGLPASRRAALAGLQGVWIHSTASPRPSSLTLSRLPPAVCSRLGETVVCSSQHRGYSSSTENSVCSLSPWPRARKPWPAGSTSSCLREAGPLARPP